ncbi:Uma2 family endonuclease [Tumidithrix elongata RA019]|uniref:Uma2 family endonuclease n=1 Tax=Tumidithrix elongata BACA0141 TaxID=2716417 RepID=A0AAW9Q568_9CYAN|nr:Uma2 family endonuclease [Tumidithrix elongata RA019]
MVNLSYQQNRALPTAEQLSCSDETPVDNQLQNDIPNLLLFLLSFIWAKRDDWYFGIDMAVYYNPDEPAIVPDGFLAVGVKRDTGERGRLSYVLWEENYITPVIALEVVSEKYNGEYEGKLEDYQALGILYYAIYNPLSGRRGRHKYRDRLEVYKLISGEYKLISLNVIQKDSKAFVWMPELDLGLGYENGEHLGWQREWLYWYDKNGDRYLSEAEQERQAKLVAEAIAEKERMQKENLAARLRALGVDLNEI